MSLLPILLHFRKPLILQKLKEKNSNSNNKIKFIFKNYI